MTHSRVLIPIRRRSLAEKMGSITVFMSLAGLLILAMVGTCVETARYSTCAGTGAEMLRNGAEALLTEYSRPLYDHYGLFFIEDTGEPFEKVIADYVNDSLEAKPLFSNFLKGELTGLEVTKKTYAGDDQAYALMREIVTYMERHLTGGMLNKLMKKIGRFSSVEEDAKQIEETVEEEREDKKLDDHIVRLMYLVDGVRISGSGNVKTQAYFVKKFSTDADYTGADFGIMEGKVWNEVKKHIDETPSKWNDTGSAFRAKLRNVIEKTEEAVREADAMRETYSTAKHSDLADRVIAGLPSLRGNLRVLQETEKLLDSSLKKKELKHRLKELWKDYNTTALSFDYTGIDSTGSDQESPLSALGSGLGDGLLSLVCEHPAELSKKGIKNPDRYADYYKESAEKSENYSERATRFTEDEEVELSGVLDDTGSYAMEEFALDTYITEKFPGYTQKIDDKTGGLPGDAESETSVDALAGQPLGDSYADSVSGGPASNEGITGSDGSSGNRKWKHALDYGWEYVVSGEKSDKGNLEEVLGRILLIRVATNFIAIMADGKKRAEAFAAAAAIVGVTGLVFLIRFTQTLFLIAWAFVESLTDIAAILMKKHVPVVKTSAQIKTTFPEIFLITNSAIVSRAKKYADEKNTSFGYREYILLFLVMTKPEVCRYRVMDLIDNDMRKNGYEGFSIGKCVFDMKVEGYFYYPAGLFQLPSIGRLLGRDLDGREYLAKIRAGYL